MVKIKIDLPAGNIANANAEWLWAKELGNGAYEIDSIPFYAKGINLGDVIRARDSGNGLVMESIVSRGGHSTYRVYAYNGREGADALEVLSRLQSLGCAIEPATPKLVSVDVPPDADKGEVINLLGDAEKAGFIGFEEGYSAGKNTASS